MMTMLLATFFCWQTGTGRAVLRVLLLLKRRNGLKQGGCSDDDDSDDVDDGGEFPFMVRRRVKPSHRLRYWRFRQENASPDRAPAGARAGRSILQTATVQIPMQSRSDPNRARRGHIKQIASPWHGVRLHGFRNTFHHFYLNLITNSYILYAETQSAIPQGLPPGNHSG